jgi:hypothetical protein
MQLVEVLVFSGSLSYVWFFSFGLFCLLRLRSLHFVSFSLPFLGAFFYKFW